MKNNGFYFPRELLEANLHERATYFYSKIIPHRFFVETEKGIMQNILTGNKNPKTIFVLGPNKVGKSEVLNKTLNNFYYEKKKEVEDDINCTLCKGHFKKS